MFIDIDIFEELINSPLCGVFIYQENGEIVFANSTFASLMGYEDPDELLGISFFKFLPDGEKAAVKKVVERRLRGERFYLEHTGRVYIAKDRSRKPVRTFGQTIIFRAKFSGLVFVIDETEARSLEKLFYALSQINQIAIHAEDEQMLKKEVCNALVGVGYASVCIGKVDENSRVFNVEYYNSRLPDVDGLFKEIVIKADGSIPFGRGTVYRAYTSGNIAIISNVLKSRDMSGWWNYHKRYNIHSACSVPIVKNGKVEYILLLHDDVQDSFSDKNLYLLKEIQRDFAFALDKLEKERFANLASSALNIGFDFVLIVDEGFRVTWANQSAGYFFGYSVENIKGIPFFELVYERANYMKKELSSTKVVVSGIFNYRHSSGRKIPMVPTVITRMETDKGKVYIVVGKDVTGEHRLQEKINTLTRVDEVTGLPNRRHFLETIRVVVDSFLLQGEFFGCVAVVNPLNFDQINQAFGMNAGDKILREIGKRIRSSVKKYDEVARLDSDKFGILLKGLRNEEDALIIMDRVLEKLKEPYEIENQQVEIGFTIGLSLIPRDGKSGMALISRAQSALVDARIKGENSCSFYRKDLEVQASSKLRLKKELNRALNRNEFIVYYQPYFDNKGRIAGAEALLRWQKNGNVVSPMSFVPYLEETGQIVAVEKLVLLRVLEMFELLEERAITPVPVSLNISPVSLRREDFFDEFSEMVRRSALEPEYIHIEIVERAFINEIDRTVALMKKMKDRGFKFLIDDFGTGYSSLSYLSELPVDFVKIDISFVSKLLRDRRAASVVKSIIGLSHDLGIEAIAEGVESHEQLEHLKSIGSDYFQGYLFNRPMPERDFIDLIADVQKEG